MNTKLVVFFAWLSAPVALLHAADTPEPPTKPNIVFILADDQRFDELGCTGDSIIKTPNIDGLAREGVVFENSFVTSASCLPNRTSLLTGQWERRHTVGWNSGSALSHEQWADTLPMVLKRNGYITAYLGKNHTPGLRYWDFDYYYGNRLGHLGFYPKPRQPIFNNAKADTQIEILGEGAANFMETQTEFVKRAGDKAEHFLRERPKDKPFFLYVCFNVPHGAGTRSMQQRPTDDALYRTAYRDVMDKIPPPPGYVAAKDIKEPKIPTDVYSGKQISQYDYRFSLDSLREQRVRICETVTGIDRVVGQIQEQLQRLGIADNTIFIYSSDNGILHGEHGYGGKCLLYEPSIRVPLIIHDPRVSPDLRGRRRKELVLSEDVAPTILDLCGLPTSASMQGRSLRPLLRGQSIQWRRDFFCESLILLQDYPVIQAVRSEAWKYIRYWPNRRTPTDYRDLLNLGLNGESPAYEELFHLAADPLEQQNLARDPKHRARLAAMRARCTDLLRETRGAPQTLLTTSVTQWMNEAPAEWKDIFPLLSAPARAEDRTKSVSALLPSSLAALPAADGPAQKPNILVVLADDLGYADVGFNGCRDIPTPNIDRLAEQGVRCTSGYVTHSFCSPTRAGLLAGRYQQRFGHENNPAWLPESTVAGLPISQTTLPQVLNTAGYVTGCVGKWHLGAHPQFHPNRRGFKEYFGLLGGGHVYIPGAKGGVEYLIPMDRNGRPEPLTEYLTTVLGQEGSSFITRHKGQPWFLYLAFNAPHTPLQVTDPLMERVKHITDETRRGYAGLVVGLDDAVGVVMNALKESGQVENTLVFFFSDNGGPISVTHSDNTPLRGAKGQVFEGGIRVPFLVSWPGRLPQGKDYAHPVISLDVFATAVALAGAKVPDSHALEGTNILPYLAGERTDAPHDRLFWRSGGGTKFAVREGDWKLVGGESGGTQLFNLVADVGESKDLAAARPEVLARLGRAYADWNKDNIAPLFESPQANRPKAARKARAK